MRSIVISFLILSTFWFNIPAKGQMVTYHKQQNADEEQMVNEKFYLIDSLGLYFIEKYDKKGFLSSTYYSQQMDSIVYTGQYVSYDSLSNIRWTKEYQDGKLDGSLTSYWPNGETKRLDRYSNDEWIEGTCYDSLGKEVEYYEFEKLPEFLGGKDEFIDVIYQNLKYPKKAWRKGLQGRVIVQFVIDETGKITEPRIVKSPGSSFTKATYDLILKLSKKYRWSPGEIDGEKVEVLYTAPIDFKFR